MVIKSSNGNASLFASPWQNEAPRTGGNQQEDLNQYCVSHPTVFVCKAFECNQNSFGAGFMAQFTKLKCIQNVCASNPSEIVCQKLTECEEQKNTTGLFAFSNCVVQLFSDQQ